jgi:hypothetical protein
MADLELFFSPYIKHNPSYSLWLTPFFLWQVLEGKLEERGELLSLILTLRPVV